jgi:integrative and conjugative element protein (TIGR02256 family)
MSMRFVEEVGGPGIILTDEALSSMFEYRQLGPTAKEGGGQLFAKFAGADTIIVEATTPKLLDKRTRRGLKPNRMLQRIEIWDRHKKGLHFVGDWHTHPEEVPRPSWKDIEDMAECYLLSTHTLRAFIMIIIGTEPGHQGLYAALINQRGTINLTMVS